MRRSFLIVLMLLSSSPAALSGGGMTARKGLAKAVETAKKWSSDAVLTAISSMEILPGGTARSWIYGFYSPSSGKFYHVDYGPSTWRTLEVRVGSTEPVGEKFIDSDKAWAEAVKNKIKGKEPSMAVKVLGSGAEKALYWAVNGGFNKGDVSVLLDAATGKLHYRGEVP
jgi:hypothetical protein